MFVDTGDNVVVVAPTDEGAVDVVVSCGSKGNPRGGRETVLCVTETNDKMLLLLRSL